MKRIYRYFSIFLMGFLLVGCVDDFLLKDEAIGDGEAQIQATVSFFPHVESLETRSTPGNAIHDINNLSVIIYDEYKKFHAIYNSANGDFKFTTKDHGDKPSMSDDDANHNGEWSTEKQKQASFSLPNIPYGKYYIFCVANMGVLTRNQVETIEDLKKIPLTWNPGNIASNNQMFGYFTTQSAASSDKPVAGFGDVALTVNQLNQPLHAWIKRAASKVTVAFDGTNLFQGVHIYIRKVTIKDIPKTCLLGADNTPAKMSDLISEGESIYYKTSGITDKDPGDNSDNWLQVTNNYKPQETFHASDASSLFFFENMQGDKESLGKDYCKQPQIKDVNQFLENLAKDPNARPESVDTKDKVTEGSYIEVEGFYLSQNPTNPGQGNIKYRFMLGKNTTYNYDAQRNHHYKVTLRFNGWANQPEWHIDYVEDSPGLYPPDRFYMPYLYHQKAMMPIKVNGPLTSLKLEIVENDWAPRDPDSYKLAKDYKAIGTNPGEGAGMPLSYYDFIWNQEAHTKFNDYKLDGNNVERPYLGFLALTLPRDNPSANILMNYNYSEQETAFKALETYYLGKGQGNSIPQNERTLTIFSDSDNDGYDNNTSVDVNKYQVAKNGNFIVFQVPLFTRAKSMVTNTDFSGNNPYAYHPRYAKLKITAVYDAPSAQDPAKTTVIKYVDIIQVPRITNPKAVWKKTGDASHFDVTLMTRSNPGANADYESFVSDGAWTAQVDQIGGYSNFTIEGNGGDYVSTSDKFIEGRTSSAIKFRINFKGASACGIITVRYHGLTCVHRIFVRQGFDPIQVNTGGAWWSSYNVYSADADNFVSGNNVVTCVRTKTPQAIGTLFRKGNYRQGILSRNNDTWGALVNGTYNFVVSGDKNKKYNWSEISYTGSTTDYSFSWPKFKEGKVTYRVPSFQEYKTLMDNSEFGFGVMYGPGATTTQTLFTEAEGYDDYGNTGKEDKRGVKGIVVYNNNNANQVFFSMGKYGQGRRTNFNLQGQNEGVLRYGDVTNLLTGDGNLYRPIPYNLGHQPGSIYWIRQTVSANVSGTGQPCGGWDMNYFSFNFAPYTNNCLKDAMPIRLILDR